MENKIYLVPIGTTEDSVLASLGTKLEKTFNSRVERYERMELPQDAFNSKRNQFYCPRLLDKLRTFVKPVTEVKALGIADVDLYVQGLNFVFGQAELGGHLAVISLTRLHQSFYGLPENNRLFMERALKEAVHELGHVYGLEHCPDPECVMHFSNSLMDTDRKSASFCPRCQVILKKLMKSN